jgi:hypothetical protein
MKKTVAHVTFGIFLLFVFIGCGFLYMLANNKLAGFISIPFFLLAYVGFHFILRFWPNHTLLEVADYPHFIKWAFNFHLAMGIIFFLAQLQQTKVDELMAPSFAAAALDNYYAAQYQNWVEQQNIKKVFRTIIYIVLFAPWVIRKTYLMYNSEPK